MTHCVNSWRSPIRISLRWIWLPKQFSLFSLVFLVILREETFLVLWIISVLNPAELKVTSYKAASKLHYKYFSLIFNRFVTKLLFLTKASLMHWAILRPYGAPWWPFWTREMVPTHPPRCVLPWSNLDPHWSTILKPPGMHMARSAIYGTFWTVFWP